MSSRRGKGRRWVHDIREWRHANFTASSGRRLQMIAVRSTERCRRSDDYIAASAICAAFAVGARIGGTRATQARQPYANEHAGEQHDNGAGNRRCGDCGNRHRRSSRASAAARRTELLLAVLHCSRRKAEQAENTSHARTAIAVILVVAERAELAP